MSLPLSSAVALLLLLSACRPQDLPTTPLPAELRVSVQIDSIIVVDQQASFSQVYPVGRGPKGALIRYNLKSSNRSKSFTTLTYNEQNQLVGLFDYNEGYGQQMVQQAHYRGGYVATVWIAYLPSLPWGVPRSQSYLESLKKDVDTQQPDAIIKYQYDERKQVARILSYQRIWGTNRFKLSQLTENKYTYNSANQLQQVSATTYPGYPSPRVVVYHWQGGDIIQQDEVPSPTSSGTTAITKYSYGPELNPFARSNVLFNSMYQSQHNLTSLTYSNGSSTLFDYRYQYDSQGRLVSQVLGDETGTGSWLGYTFEYAP